MIYHATESDFTHGQPKSCKDLEQRCRTRIHKDAFSPDKWRSLPVRHAVLVRASRRSLPNMARESWSMGGRAGKARRSWQRYARARATPYWSPATWRMPDTVAT